MKLYDRPVRVSDGRIEPCGEQPHGGIAENILKAHGGTRVKFDALISHDITYVGIIQTARASGLKKFPLPYAFTNCHNSLCAVGGTINEDDHVFGLSAAKSTAASTCPPISPSSTSTPASSWRCAAA